jgi:hypothetical protein
MQPITKLTALEYESCDNDCYECLVYKVSLGYVALALMYYFFAFRVCGFMGSVIQGKSRVCDSSTHVFVCSVGMWLYGWCYTR